MYLMVTPGCFFLMPLRISSLGGSGSRMRICSFAGVASPIMVDFSADKQ